MDHTSHTPKSKIAQALRLLADAIEAEEPPLALTEWISHRDPRGLGPRRQPPVVRRRISQGLSGARIVGRSFELTLEAVEEESSVLSRGHVAAAEQDESIDVVSELERELRLVGVGR